MLLDKLKIEVLTKELLRCLLLDSLLDRPKETSIKLINYVLDRPGHDFRYAVDSSKLHRELGWKASRYFKKNIKKTVSWYLKHSS